MNRRTHACTHVHTDTYTHTYTHIKTYTEFMLSPSAVPLALFNNGVWLYGKQFWKGNLRKVICVFFC